VREERRRERGVGERGGGETGGRERRENYFFSLSTNN